MMYVLEQRLRMQNIEKDKCMKVMTDLISTMCNKKFMDEVFKPQDMYTRKAIRSVFERLAHASIMRLNANSMDKLYDLMIMVVKYQISLCRRPQEILMITFVHLDSLRTFVADPNVNELIDYVCILLKNNYSTLSAGTWLDIRQSMLGYLQDIHIRVSIFLREKIQHNSGQFVISTSGQLPYGVEVPGKIRLFDRNRQKVKTIEFNSGAGQCTVTAKEGSCDLHGDRVVTLGSNIYSTVKDSVTSMPSSSRHTTVPTSASDYDMSSADPSAKAQLDLLYQLIGGTNTGRSQPACLPHFQLNLFNTDDEDVLNVRSSAPVVPAEGATYNVINIDASKKSASDELRRIMGDLYVDQKMTSPTRNTADDDDLLDLMDSVDN